MNLVLGHQRTSMGIVMKKSNTPIVKYVYGNLLEIIVKRKDLKSKTMVKNTLQEIMDEKQPLDMFYYDH